MIISIDEFRKFYNTDESDAVLGAKLSSIETMIRNYTNNNFQQRSKRCTSAIKDGVIISPSLFFKVGDTVEISGDEVNNGLYVITENYILDPTPYDSEICVITRIEYPHDIKMGVINLLKWSMEHGDKFGIASESISRHSVSYFNFDGSNSLIGFPTSLMGFLKPYMKARF